MVVRVARRRHEEASRNTSGVRRAETATKRRATLAAGLAYMRHASRRFEAGGKASDPGRHAKLTKAVDRKLRAAKVDVQRLANPRR